MTTTTEQTSQGSSEQGRVAPTNDHPLVSPAEQFTKLAQPRQQPQPSSYLAAATQNVPQMGNHTKHNNGTVSSGLQAESAMMASAAADLATASSEIKGSIGDQSSLLPPAGEPMGHNAQKSLNHSTHPQDVNHAAPASEPPRRPGPPLGDPRDEKDGYERKIGRGTSWRRDHETLDTEEYYARGRGRGASTRGRPGYHYRDFESRDYPYRREYDRRLSPPPPSSASASHHSHLSLEPRGRPYLPHDPYYDSSRGLDAYPYDTRRDYPPEPSRYFEDYRRGYDPRDGPPPPLPLPSSSEPVEPRRPYDRGPYPGREDPYYSRPGDPRDDYRPDQRIPSREPLPPDPRDPRADPRYRDEGIMSTSLSVDSSGRDPRRVENPRMLPPPPPPPPPPPESKRSRDSLEFRDEGVIDNRRSSTERLYASSKSESTQNKLEDSPDAKRKDISDPGSWETLNNGTASRQPASQRPPMGSKLDEQYGFDRGRHGPPPPPPPREDRYRDPPGDYGRASYSTYEGRGGVGGGGVRDSDSRGPPVDYRRSRDPRDPPYSSTAGYPPPPIDYRGSRDAYPPPLDFVRGSSYDERYPRGSPMDLEPPARGKEAYRDLPPRHDYGPKRKYEEPEFRDPYYDDFRARDPRYMDHPMDYPLRPPYDYDDRDPKRPRGPPDPRDPAYGRSPPFDGPPLRPEYDRLPHPPPMPGSHGGGFRPSRERPPHGRYFLLKTSTMDTILKSRETGLWGVAVKDVETIREAYKAGDVTFVFALDESGRFCGYAEMASDVDSVPTMTWMDEHCSPIGGAFEVKHRTTDDVRTIATTKARNFLTEGKPVRFGKDCQEISAKEAAALIDELERMSGPENAQKRASAALLRGAPRGVRSRGIRGTKRSPSYSRGRGR